MLMWVFQHSEEIGTTFHTVETSEEIGTANFPYHHVPKFKQPQQTIFLLSVPRICIPFPVIIPK